MRTSIRLVGWAVIEPHLPLHLPSLGKNEEDRSATGDERRRPLVSVGLRSYRTCRCMIFLMIAPRAWC